MINAWTRFWSYLSAMEARIIFSKSTNDCFVQHEFFNHMLFQFATDKEELAPPFRKTMPRLIQGIFLDLYYQLQHAKSVTPSADL